MKLFGACIQTHNISEMVAFYSKIFEQEPEVDGGVDYRFYTQQVVIFKLATEDVVQTKDLALIYEVPNVDETYERMKSFGIEGVPPTDKPWGVRSFILHDPDGNSVSFFCKLNKNPLIQKSSENYTIRNVTKADAAELSRLRVEIDGETEFLDREPGEDYMSESDFVDMIQKDLLDEKSLFLVAEVNGKIVGYTRCIGKKLCRFRHLADFGICILQQYCGKGIGKAFLSYVTEWSENVGIEKISLSVVETNFGAIELYKRFGFIQEGLLRHDRKHKDGNYYGTVIMGRVNEKKLD